MKRITKTDRIIKDLNFLLAIPKIQVSPGIVKRVQVEGVGEVLKDIKVPCNIYYSYYKYDYQGRFINHMLNKCLRPGDCSAEIHQAIMSMKLEQKSWFNIKPHESQEQGCHYQMIIDELKYKNSSNFQSKKLLSEECRKQGKALYEEKHYEEAMKKYLKEINISQGIQKNKFTAEELAEIEKINQKARVNFLRCFTKLTSFDESTAELAEKYSKQFLKVKDDDLSLFLRSKVLMQKKYLSNALELANELGKRGSKQAPELIQLIEQKMKQKK